MSYFSSLATVQIIILSVIVMIIIYFTIPWNNRQSPHRPRWCVEGGTFYAVDICLPHLKIFVKLLLSICISHLRIFFRYLSTVHENIWGQKNNRKVYLYIYEGEGSLGYKSFFLICRKADSYSEIPKLRIPRDITGWDWWYRGKLTILME